MPPGAVVELNRMGRCSAWRRTLVGNLSPAGSGAPSAGGRVEWSLLLRSSETVLYHSYSDLGLPLRRCAQGGAPVPACASGRRAVFPLSRPRIWCIVPGDVAADGGAMSYPAANTVTCMTSLTGSGDAASAHCSREVPHWVTHAPRRLICRRASFWCAACACGGSWKTLSCGLNPYPHASAGAVEPVGAGLNRQSSDVGVGYASFRPLILMLAELFGSPCRPRFMPMFPPSLARRPERVAHLPDRSSYSAIDP